MWGYGFLLAPLLRNDILNLEDSCHSETGPQTGRENPSPSASCYLSRLDYGNGDKVQYIYDDDNHLTRENNGSGTAVVQYTYDAWGKLLSTTGSMASTIGTLNPLRYRGYVYDQETELYYLQSRYYDPEMGRFINADSIDYLGASGTLLGYNLFAYCENNPVNLFDYSGRWAEKCYGFTKTSVGFDVKYNKSFLSKNYCLQYAEDVIKQYGGWSWVYGYSYKNMSAKRIAIELYAHAVLYVIGAGLIVNSIANQVLAVAISKFASRGKLNTLKTTLQKISYLQNKLGCYLVDRTKIINVNNNETIVRMAVFNVIWSLGIV